MLKLLILIPTILLILFIRFCAISIKKQWIDKKPISSGNQCASQNILSQFQNKDKRAAIEHVIYMEEDESEKNPKSKKKQTDKIKTAYLTKLDSLIAKNKLIESVVESDVGAMQIFKDDLRQIIILYKYMCYGDPPIQKRGIKRITRWYGNPKKVEKFKQDSIFVNYKPKIVEILYRFLDSKYPAFQVASALALVSMGISDSLITDKLNIYANKIGINDWNLQYTDSYIEMNYSIKHYGLRYTDSELSQFKNQAIQELIQNAKKGINLINYPPKKLPYKLKELYRKKVKGY